MVGCCVLVHKKLIIRGFSILSPSLSHNSAGYQQVIVLFVLDTFFSFILLRFFNFFFIFVWNGCLFTPFGVLLKSSVSMGFCVLCRLCRICVHRL